MLLKSNGFAVVGASHDKNKVGHVVFKNLLESRIKAYPVNPKTENILGQKCYRNIVELKGLVSHAVIAVPARLVPQVIDECGVAGVKTAIIISAGFSEVGNNELEAEVVKLARNHGMKILGPNVLGVAVPGEFNASFFEGELKKGSISFISQSGALGVAVLDLFASKGWGLRSFISVGNTSDITITDTLKELLSDKETKCVLIYVESLKNGREFIDVCKNSSKPIFVLKAGTSAAGRRAAATHTGALAGSNRIYSAAFKQCGIKRVNSLTSLINAGLVCEKYGLIGSKALIITNAGGPGILMTDALAKRKIKLPRLPSNLIEKLNKELEGVAWSRNNPIDVVGDALPERYSRTLNAVRKYDFYDYVIVLLTPQAMTQPLSTAKEVVNFAKVTGKPVFPCFLGGESIKEAMNYMKREGLIVFDKITNVAHTMSSLDFKSSINNH